MGKTKWAVWAIVSLLVATLLLSLTNSVTAKVPIIYGCDSAGSPSDFFGPGQHVYACGSNYDPNEKITIYVVRYEDPYAAAYSKKSCTVEADGSGNLEPVDLGTFANGRYNIWVDRATFDGVLYPLTEPYCNLGSCFPGLTVVPEFALGTILGLVGCFAALGLFAIRKRNSWVP